MKWQKEKRCLFPITSASLLGWVPNWFLRIFVVCGKECYQVWLGKMGFGEKQPTHNSNVRDGMKALIEVLESFEWQKHFWIPKDKAKPWILCWFYQFTEQKNCRFWLASFPFLFLGGCRGPNFPRKRVYSFEVSMEKEQKFYPFVNLVVWSYRIRMDKFGVVAPIFSVFSFGECLFLSNFQHRIFWSKIMSKLRKQNWKPKPDHSFFHHLYSSFSPSLETKPCIPENWTKHNKDSISLPFWEGEIIFHSLCYL